MKIKKINKLLFFVKCEAFRDLLRCSRSMATMLEKKTIFFLKERRRSVRLNSKEILNAYKKKSSKI